MIRPSAVGATVALAAVVLVGCTTAEESATPGGSEGTTSESAGVTTLVASYPQEPGSWNYLEDPSTALMVPTYLNVVESLFETAQDGGLQPLLAESVDVSDDGLAYTIRLREAVFHDGSSFDSADVLYSLDKNATSVSGTVAGPLAVIVSADAPDAQTVVLEIAAPSSAFLTALGTVATLVVPEGFFESADAGAKLIGTGPFVFGEYVRDGSLTLDRFEDYWGDKPYMETIVHRFMSDETSSINALRAGELDVIGMLLGEGIDQVAGFIDDDSYAISFTPATQSSFVFLNPDADVMRDERVRQAIAHAIDREPIVQAAVSGYADATCVYLVPGNVPWASNYCPYAYDPDRSRELLAEAGYAEGLTIDFPYLTIAEFPVSFEILNAQLQAVGITVNARGQDLATWLDQVFGASADYEIAHITNNPSVFGYGCEGGLAPLGVAGKALCDEEFEAFVANNDQITDRGEYLVAMESMVNHFADMAWVIPLFGKTEPTIARADIEGIAPYRTNLEMDYRNITWK
jgi:peptide/nickel transport system substrate-binding protein